MQTIFALSTRPGKSGVAVIRVSGPDAAKVPAALGINGEIKPRIAKFAKFLHPVSKIWLDSGLVLFFPAPYSFTGEDVVELQLHGSIAVINSMIEALSQIGGLRLAEPGEFSKRSFLNGKMDLTQAEAIADLIDAETAAQQRQALRQIEGELSQLYESWRQQLLHILSFVEAYIDFPDQDLPEDLVEDIENQVDKLIIEMNQHLGDNRRGEKLRQGIYAIIIGAPNVGKSSLLNYLAKRDAAIVSSIPGTTRDIIEVHLDLAGYPLIIADSAGLRNTSDVLEEEGIKRAKARALNADLKIAIFDASELPHLDQTTLEMIDEDSIVVINKIDQIADLTMLPTEIKNIKTIAISITNAVSLELLLDQIEMFLSEELAESNLPVITRTRYRECVTLSVVELQNFTLSKEIEFAAEDLRQAARHLSTITGKFDVDEILGEIFSSFCIGK